MEASIYITEKCNLRCRHCYVPKTPKSLEVRHIEYIMDEFPIDRTVLLGGEPLLYKDLSRILEILPNVTISTNAQLLDKKLKEIEGVRAVQISVEGTKDYNDYIRGEGTFDKCIRNALLLKNIGIDVHLRVGYCDENLNYVVDLIENYSKPLEIPTVLFPRIDKPPLNTDAQLWLYTYVMNIKDVNVFVSQPNFFCFIGSKGYCPAGSHRINFTADGRITPCNMDFNYVVGMLDMKGNHHSTWDEVEEALETYCRFVKIPYPECVGCEYMHICKSGCKVANTYLGCPLRKHISIRDIESGLSLDDIKNKRGEFRKFVKSIFSC